MINYLALLTVVLHVSTPYPTHQDPKAYGLNHCSGVLIAEDTILTAYHCVEESRGNQWVKTHDGLSHSAEIVKTSPRADLALLKIKSLKKYRFAEIGKDTDKGDKIMTYGSSHGMDGTYSEGIVNNILINTTRFRIQIIHSANMYDGISGGGLFNKKGKLVGINTATMPFFGVATDTAEIRAFLRE